MGFYYFIYIYYIVLSSDIIILLAVLGIGYFVVTKTGLLGGGGGGKGNTAAGDCGKTVYPKTGRTLQMPGKKGTRNYASGKPSETTWESEVNADSSWKNYELTTYFTAPKGDDNFDHKMYGPNHKKGAGSWYVWGVSSKGEAICGAETKHPGPNPKTKCSGGTKTSFGSLLGKKVGLKSAIWTDSAGSVHVEGYVDAGTGKWEKMSSMVNPGGWKFTPKSPQNLLFRADGFEGIKVHCSVAQEIKPPGGGSASKTTSKEEKKKANFAYRYDGSVMHYAQQPRVSYLVSPALRGGYIN